MICWSVGVTIFLPALAVHSMIRWPAAAQVQSPIWSLSIMPQDEDEPTFFVRSRLAGGAGSAGVIYEARSRVRGSCRASLLPNLSLRVSIRVGSDFIVTSPREPVAARFSFFNAMRTLLGLSATLIQSFLQMRNGQMPNGSSCSRDIANRIY